MARYSLGGSASQQPPRHKELPMYEHLERLFQGLAPTSEYLKGVYYELADEFFKQLRQQIEVTQTELRESEQLEIYYHAQGEEPILGLDHRVGHAMPF